MQNAHLRLGRLEYQRSSGKTNTHIFIHVSHYVARPTREGRLKATYRLLWLYQNNSNRIYHFRVSLRRGENDGHQTEDDLHKHGRRGF